METDYDFDDVRKQLRAIEDEHNHLKYENENLKNFLYRLVTKNDQPLTDEEFNDSNNFKANLSSDNSSIILIHNTEFYHIGERKIKGD